MPLSLLGHSYEDTAGEEAFVILAAAAADAGSHAVYVLHHLLMKVVPYTSYLAAKLLPLVSQFRQFEFNLNKTLHASSLNFTLMSFHCIVAMAYHI